MRVIGANRRFKIIPSMLVSDAYRSRQLKRQKILLIRSFITIRIKNRMAGGARISLLLGMMETMLTTLQAAINPRRIQWLKGLSFLILNLTLKKFFWENM